jgi:hypothetical protein
MYAAVRRYEGIKDDDEAARLVRDSFMPQLEKVQGFIAYYWIDAGEGIMASLSVFEDKAGADESVKFAHKWIEVHHSGSSNGKTVISHLSSPSFYSRGACDQLLRQIALGVPARRRTSHVGSL